VRPQWVFRRWKVNFFTFQNFSHEALNDPFSTSSWSRAHTAGTFRLNTDVQFRNFWTANVGVFYNPDLMSRRATRGGPRMADPGSAGFSVRFGTDNRKLVSVRPNLSVSRGRQGDGNRFTVGVGTTIQPSSQLLVTVTPTWTSSSTGSQYVAATGALSYAPTFGTRYLFADLERRDFSMVTRVNLTFTPTLSLELFAQPLISAVDYVTYKQLAAAETFDFDVFAEGTPTATGCTAGRTCVDGSGRRFVDFDGDGSSDFAFTDRDFNLRSLRSTAVLRWEYRPGSTLFLVWQHRQSDRVALGDFDAGRDVGALFRAPSDDVLIVKANVWLTR